MYSMTMNLRLKLVAILFAIAGALALGACAPGDGRTVNAEKTATAAAPADRGAETVVARYDDEGALIRPTGYREWIYIGTPLTPNDLNGGNAAFPEFHNVYIDPASWAEYRKTGQFPDGAVVIKELISVGGKSASSGKGYFMGEFVGLEAAVKDSRRYPKEANGWAYFSYGHSYPLSDKARAQPQVACAQCHLTAPQGGMVFSQYYPVLRARAVSAP